MNCARMRVLSNVRDLSRKVVLPSPDQTKLVGIWCAPCGGFLFYDLIFRPDGTGVAETGNYFLTTAILFDWQYSDEDLLITGREKIELNETQDALVNIPWVLNVRIRVIIGTVKYENAAIGQTLKLASALDDGWPLEYISGNPKYNIYTEPDFGLLPRRPL